MTTSPTKTTNPRRLKQPLPTLWDTSRRGEAVTVAQAATMLRMSTTRVRRWLLQPDGPASMTLPNGSRITRRDWLTAAWTKLNKQIGDETERENRQRESCVREAQSVGYQSSVVGVRWCKPRQAWAVVLRWRGAMRFFGYIANLATAEAHARRLKRIRDSGVSWADYKRGDYTEPPDENTRQRGALPTVDDTPIDPTLPTAYEIQVTQDDHVRERKQRQRRRALGKHIEQ